MFDGTHNGNVSISRVDGYPWRLFFFLVLLGSFGAVASIPYSLALSANVLRSTPLPLPISVIIGLQLVQTAGLLAVATGVGILAARSLRLGAPFFEKWVYRSGAGMPLREITRNLICGVAASVIIAFVARIVFLPHVPQPAIDHLAAWKRFLACFYGAFDEEILMRLFLLSSLIWLLAKLLQVTSIQASPAVFWITNAIVALLFGAGHLPAASLIMPLTFSTILYILSLNGLASLLFGYLFWRYGLEAAMLAHFSSDVMLQLVIPAVTQ